MLCFFHNSNFLLLEGGKFSRLGVKCSVNKKSEDLHHVFLAKGHKPDVNSTER
jgi:hypothetical protein